MVDSPAIDGITFQGMDKREHFQFYFRQHWIRLLTPFFKMVIGSCILLLVGGLMFFQIGIEDVFLRRLLLLLVTAGFVFIQLEFLWRFFRHFLYAIIVTDKKLHRVKKTLLCTDDHQSIDLWQLQDISKHQHGIIQNIFGYGTLKLEAQETVLRLHFIPRVAKKHGQLLKLRERARVQQSIRKPDGTAAPGLQPA